jgi:hypothetical protein
MQRLSAHGALRWTQAEDLQGASLLSSRAKSFFGPIGEEGEARYVL